MEPSDIEVDFVKYMSLIADKGVDSVKSLYYINSVIDGMTSVKPLGKTFKAPSFNSDPINPFGSTKELGVPRGL